MARRIKLPRSHIYQDYHIYQARTPVQDQLPAVYVIVSIMM